VTIAALLTAAVQSLTQPGSIYITLVWTTRSAPGLKYQRDKKEQDLLPLFLYLSHSLVDLTAVQRRSRASRASSTLFLSLAQRHTFATQTPQVLLQSFELPPKTILHTEIKSTSRFNSRMTSNMSQIARTGSHTSTSTSGYDHLVLLVQRTSSNISCSTMDSSSHNHTLSFHSIQNLPSWLNTSWLPYNHRHERIATGTHSMGMAILTTQMMEMHIQQAPDIRGMMDCSPVADKSNAGFIGWRQKLGTWPKS
jgi:hypothetical protein